MSGPGLLERVFSAFEVPGDFVAAAPYGSGHINETYAIQANLAGTPVRYLLQRLNTSIFKDPAGLMSNVERVTGHLRRKLAAEGRQDASRRSLTVLHSHDGQGFLDDPELGFWRGYLFIEGARTYDLLETTDQAHEAARAFGAFQRLLSDYDGPRLLETVPDFHDSRKRFETLRRAAETDPAGRARETGPELEFAFARESLVDVLLDLHASGAIPERITHNDTKLNNVLLDDATGEGICVLDLDTVMPGMSLYDFGDLVRSVCNPVPEDHPDPSAVTAREDMFSAVAHGYLEGTGGGLLQVERDHLLTAGRLLTFECGLRFLTDHLQGDTYFRIHRPGQNLDRARTQFALVASLETRADALRKCIRDL
jgi:hypothetical protein